MVFFVLTAAPQFGFGYFFMPLQIGSNEMAFPLLTGTVVVADARIAGWRLAASFFLPIQRDGAVVVECGVFFIWRDSNFDQFLHNGD